MQIVSQSASLLYSPFPPQFQLPAPPIRKALPAPRVAGLLPAVVPLRVEIVTEKPPTLNELLKQLGPIPSREAMNAEIADLALEALQFLNGLRSRSAQRLVRE
jgi:hypothetical protein